MNKSLILFAALISLSALVVDTADARRLGGGASVGKQRSIQAAPAPTPQPAPSAAPAPIQQPQPAGASRWLGPLAGLALGAGLASLFMGHGFGGVLGTILMFALAAFAIMFVLRMLRSQPPSRPLQYAGAGTTGAPPELTNNFGGGATLAAVPRFPQGFNADEFAHHAKLNFTRLQAANDQRDIAALKDFMTPALFAEISTELNKRDGAQQTDVVTIDAEVLEVVTEGANYVASVRFSGMLRESSDGAAESFVETWHLEKPLDGSTGWLLAGIQQN
jgi:predicted lipid-binding transport protein (Tim44 family)